MAFQHVVYRLRTRYFVKPNRTDNIKEIGFVFDVSKEISLPVAQKSTLSLFTLHNCYVYLKSIICLHNNPLHSLNLLKI